MKTEELKQIALAAAKNIKSQQDLAEFQQMLTKVTVESALSAELVDHGLRPACAPTANR